MTDTYENLAAVVDEIGLIKAALAPQVARLEELKERLRKEGPDRYSGNLFDAVVVQDEAMVVNMKRLRLMLTPGQIELVKVATPRTRVNVYARVLTAA